MEDPLAPPRVEFRCFLLWTNGANNKDEAIVMVDPEFGEFLRKHRKDKQLSQEEAAEKAGVSPMTYGRIERGEVSPKYDQVQAIFGVLGIESSEAAQEREDKLSAKEYFYRIESYMEKLKRSQGW